MIRKNLKPNLAFWAIVFFSLLPFIILSFFCRPGGEDYAFDLEFRGAGFWKEQIELYQHWNGRFFANFLLAAGVRMNFISHFYFLPSLLLFFFTVVAAFLLFRTVNKLLLNRSLTPGR